LHFYNNISTNHILLQDKNEKESKELHLKAWCRL